MRRLVWVVTDITLYEFIHLECIQVFVDSYRTCSTQTLSTTNRVHLKVGFFITMAIGGTHNLWLGWGEDGMGWGRGWMGLAAKWEAWHCYDSQSLYFISSLVQLYSILPNFLFHLAMNFELINLGTMIPAKNIPISYLIWYIPLSRQPPGMSVGSYFILYK